MAEKVKILYAKIVLQFTAAMLDNLLLIGKSKGDENSREYETLSRWKTIVEVALNRFDEKKEDSNDEIDMLLMFKEKLDEIVKSMNE